MNTDILVRRLDAGRVAGSFLLPANVWTELGSDMRGRFRAAAFLATAGNPDRAKAVFDACLASEERAIGERERRVARLALAEIARRRGDPTTMRETLETLNAGNGQAPLRDLGFFLRQVPTPEARRR